jgi:hypothetical protein
MSLFAAAAVAKDRLRILGGGVGGRVEGPSLAQVLRLAALFLIAAACVTFAASPRVGRGAQPVSSEGAHPPGKR